MSYESKIEAPIDYEQLVGKKLWDEYKTRRETFIGKLNEEQAFCDKLNKIIIEKITDKK